MTNPNEKTAGTWSDDDPTSGRLHEVPPPAHGPLVQVNNLAEKRHAHTASMQNRVLAGIGMLLLVTLLVIVLAVSFHGISEQFALELTRIILPSAVASGATIVGVLFVTNRGRNDT